jgi:hypothetical protein
LHSDMSVFKRKCIRRPSSWLSRAGVEFLCWSRAKALLSSPQPSSNTSRTLSTAFGGPIQWHDRLCGNGRGLRLRSGTMAECRFVGSPSPGFARLRPTVRPLAHASRSTLARTCAGMAPSTMSGTCRGLMRDASTLASVSCVSEKSPFIQGISSDMGGTPDQVRQHIFHVLNERAELAPDQGYTIRVSQTLSGVFGTPQLPYAGAQTVSRLNGLVPFPTGPARQWPHASTTPRRRRTYARATGRRWISIRR